ncbi:MULTISPECIES: RNA polymerase sigma-70 factor [Roseivirga]|nr:MULTISPECIES: RNA polymerase sigma-70 factor [Roseivirga]
MSTSESKLLESFSKGDKSAFENLFKEYYEPTCRYVMRIVRDQDTAEEIVQATFVNLWEKREMIRSDISFRSYLFRAAYNTALNYIKHKKVVARHVASKQERIEEVRRNFVSHQPDFELQKRIDDALESLPPQCQRVFRMSREEGLKYHEIAEELGISKKTVEVHMGKALRILRDSLSDYLMFFLPIITLM